MFSKRWYVSDMVYKLTRFLILKAICLFSFTITGFAQATPEENFPNMELKELESELKSAEYFADLSEASTFINAENQCGVHIRTAREAIEGMRRIKTAAEAAGRTTQENVDDHAKFQNENQVALFDYRSCFTRLLVNYPTLLEVSISTYEAHKVDFDTNKGNYSNVPNLDNYIVAIENAIENKEKNNEGDFAAQLSNVHATVEVLQGGRGTTWKKVAQGYKLRINDEVRTGPEGRTRILFADRFNGTNAGPTVANVGSSSHIKIEQFITTFGNEPSRQGILGLLRGKLRVFSDIFGPRSNFTVRTGTSIASSGGTAINIGGDTQIGMDDGLGVINKIACVFKSIFTAYAQNTNIFATEVAIEYNPDSDIFTAHLDRGSASIEHNGENIILAPKTSRTVAFGNISPARPLSNNVWRLVVADTGEGYAETAQTIRVASVVEPVTKPNTATAISDIELQETYSNIDRSYARLRVSELFTSMRDYDIQNFNKLIGGSFKTIYEEMLGEGSTYYQIMRAGGLPLRWKSSCSVCIPNENEACIVKLLLEKENPYSADEIFVWVENINGDPLDKRITRLRPAQGANLAEFNSFNPVCGEEF